MPDVPTVASTPPDTGVNPTPATQMGVNPAPATSTTDQILNTSALIAQYEQRIRMLMSDKDKALHERNQAISQLTELQSQHTGFQEQTQGSLTAAANAAQQAIDRAKSLEQQLLGEQAKNIKLAALMQRPHLAPYADLIPAQADAAALSAALDQLEQIRQHDLDHYSRTTPAQLLPPPAQQVSSTPSVLQNLYGNRANMNPALFQAQPIPGSSPAHMNPQLSTTPVQGVEAIFAEAKKIGTTAAFEEAVLKAAAFAASVTY